MSTTPKRKVRCKRFTILLTITLITFLFVLLNNSVLKSSETNSVNKGLSLWENLNKSVSVSKDELKKAKGFVDKIQLLEEDGKFIINWSLRNMLRVVHLDLKGAPPKLSYFRALFPLLAEAGANALLIEYEDMFPYSGSLKNISAMNAYSENQVQQIIHWAEHYKLEVIPLIQTFGHLEFALKLQEFRHLRELDAFPQEICPSNPDSFHDLVEEMIKQVLNMHKGIRFLHIGCDEVFHLASCSRCTKRHKSGRFIFKEHVTRVAQFVREQYQGVTPLVWDDMFRSWTPTELKDSGLGNLVEPVVWVYINDIDRLVPRYVWYMYGQTFPNIWVASAFKGAYGETVVIPNLHRHFNNHISWLHFMDDMISSSEQPSPAEVRNFRGFVFTGWSRYDHFAVLCELLPPSIPSLVLNLLIVTEQTKNQNIEDEKESKNVDDVFSMWLNLLKCPPTFPKLRPYSLQTDPYQWKLAMCSFPGSNLLSALGSYVSIKAKVEAIYLELTEKKGWLTAYNVKHNFSNPFRVLETGPSGIAGQRIYKEVVLLRNSTSKVLTQYFDHHTVDEWIEQKIQPLLDKMNYLHDIAERFLRFEIWPRRPLS